MLFTTAAAATTATTGGWPVVSVGGASLPSLRVVRGPGSAQKGCKCLAPHLQPFLWRPRGRKGEIKAGKGKKKTRKGKIKAGKGKIEAGKGKINFRWGC